jgi:hypothetical protein
MLSRYIGDPPTWLITGLALGSMPTMGCFTRLHADGVKSQLWSHIAFPGFIPLLAGPPPPRNHCCQVMARFVHPSHHNIRDLAKNSATLLAFLTYVIKLVVFVWFRWISSFILLHATPLSSGDCLIIFCCGQYLAYFQYQCTRKIYTTTFPLFPLKFCSNFSP